MQLIGMLDSPYVRRVAISLKRLNLPFEHQSLSVFRDVEQFRTLNPLVKAPTLITDDGTVLMDSTLILQYLEQLASTSLMPQGSTAEALRLIGLGLMACDKTVQIVYERTLRPTDKQHQPWLDRVIGQLHAAYGQLEPTISGLSCDHPLQPEITVAVAWRFTQLYVGDIVTPDHYPQLAAFSTKVEALPVFVSTPVE